MESGESFKKQSWEEKKLENPVIKELERIAAKYQDMEFHKHSKLRVSSGRLKDMIMDLVNPQQESFKGRFDIPIIVFGQIPAQDQAKLAGVHYGLEGLYVRDWEGDPRGYRTPKGAYMTWMQDGRKNLNRKVEDVRYYRLDPDERGATIYDGIGLYVARPNILIHHKVDLPGTSVQSDGAACLERWGYEPSLSEHAQWAKADPRFGSATCGRNKS